MSLILFVRLWVVIDFLFSCVVFDFFDGFSNIDVGVNVGIIFGVYKVVCNFFFLISNEMLKFIVVRGF